LRGSSLGQRQIWWADLPEPVGSAPGFRRPLAIVQSDAFNRSRLRTVVCVPLTTNLRRAESPGNVFLPADSTGLPYDSVANVSLIVTIDRALLSEVVGTISDHELELIFNGIDLVLGR
jgi:mRNA interferase MazF